MTINLNHGVLQGRVAAITPFDNNVRLLVAVDDDYKDKNGQYVDRSYFVSVSFFGEAQIERLVRMAQKGTPITIEYKLTSYIPKNSEYHTVSVTGTNFYVASESNSAPAEKSNNTRRAPAPNSNRKSDAPEKDSEGDVPW